MKSALLRILFLFFSISALGQTTEEADTNSFSSFKNEIRSYGIVYSPPEGYKQFYKNETAIIGKLILTSSKHQLESKSDSLILYFTFGEIDTTRAFAQRLKFLGLTLDVNKNYLKTSSDTLKHPINHFPTAYARKTFNADAAGTYNLPLRSKYRGKYRNCDVLFIHKENRVDVRVYFFHNLEVSAKSLTKRIGEISRRIRFTK
jgi:hypothetical protein